MSGPGARLHAWLADELAALARFNASDRLWQLPLAAAIAMGGPLAVGAWFGEMRLGLAGSLAGLTFLYVPHTPLHHRMASLMACAFGMISCYALGLLAHWGSHAVVPLLTLVAMLVVMTTRFYALAPPGSVFFVMAAAIGAYTPASQLPMLVGAFALGALFACLVAFGYSLATLRLRAPTPVKPLPPPSFDFVVLDGVIVGATVGLSLLLAHAMSLQRPYWVPVSCLAVLQAASLHAVWRRQLHRVLGTAAGLLVATALLHLPLGTWGIVAALMVLSFIVELVVVRHYAFAVMFITPLAILLAEAGTLGQVAPGELMRARFIDTLLGCAVGLAGAACLHHVGFRAVLGALLRGRWPRRG